MKSYSQAGQDLFAYALCPTPGEFLDIGAAGLSISNTLALEEIGWRGTLIDNSTAAHAASINRATPFLCYDAVAVKYSFLPPVVEYLSLDIDGASLDALRRVFNTAPDTRFRVITIEHDFYSRGELLRTPMIELLKERGYDILCTDVCNEGYNFELWAVDPNLVDMSIANKFRRDKPTEWKEILGL